mgnify:CR=1 FL=1
MLFLFFFVCLIVCFRVPHRDFDISKDSAAPKPNYTDNEVYDPCTEDCDRDNVDSTADDPDAEGETVRYTCAAPGSFDIRLHVWDHHHTHSREYDVSKNSRKEEEGVRGREK